MNDKLTALGSKRTQYEYDRPTATLLETFTNPFSEKIMNRNNVHGQLHIEAPEFTSLCPITGQPDFARIVVDYVPNLLCVESKSFKLYLGSYRNSGEFHESCVNQICNDLVDLLQPHNLSVRGEFTPRGGIPFWPTASYYAPFESLEAQQIEE